MQAKKINAPLGGLYIYNKMELSINEEATAIIENHYLNINPQKLTRWQIRDFLVVQYENHLGELDDGDFKDRVLLLIQDMKDKIYSPTD